jgi:hypothetical protein
MLGQALAVVGLGLILDLCMLGIRPSAQAESLNLKPGAWETTGTTTSSGSKIPPHLADKFTPEQRAKMEEALKASDGKPMTTTEQSCITKKDLSHDRIIKDEDNDGDTKCRIKVISKSSSKLVAEKICPGLRASTALFTLEAKTPESYAFTLDGEMPGAGKFHTENKGRWLGASCEGIEDETRQ